MSAATTVFVSGSVYWAKVIGAPRPNYDGDAREWTVDFVPEDVSFLKEHKLLDRLKEPKEPIPGDFIRLKKSELTKDGDKNEPIRIYDADNNPWDDRLLGNGTKVDVKLKIVDWGKGKKKSIYVQAIRVTDLVPFISNEFGAMDEGKASKPKAAKKAAPEKVFAELDDDDEIPFGND